MQIHFPPNVRIRRVKPRLEGLRLQPFVNIDGEAYAKPALNGFWRLEAELLCASVQEHLALSSFLTAMRGVATTLLPLPTRWLPDLRAERPLMSGGDAPEYTTDHTGFSGNPYDGFTLSAPATHRDSYIDVDKPELVQLMPGHFVTLGERLHQVVDVSAIDEREDRIRVSLMPGVRGDYSAGTVVVVDQVQLRCSLESAGDVDLWNVPHSELSAIFIEAF